MPNIRGGTCVNVWRDGHFVYGIVVDTPSSREYLVITLEHDITRREWAFGNEFIHADRIRLAQEPPPGSKEYLGLDILRQRLGYR